MSFLTAFSSPHHQRAAENFKTAALRLGQTIPKDTCTRIDYITFLTFGHFDNIKDNAAKPEAAARYFVLGCSSKVDKTFSKTHCFSN